MNKKYISALLALGMTMSVGFTSVYADPASADKAKIQQVQTQRNNLETKVEIMDNQVETIMNNVSVNENNITKTQKNIKQNKINIEKAEASIKAEQILFDQRMKVMYMNGTTSYIDVLLKSNGIDDFISRLEDVKKIVIFDEDVINDLKKQEEAVSLKKVALKTENTKLLSLRVENKEKLTVLSKQKSDETVFVAQLNAQENQYGAQLVTDQATAARQAKLAREAIVAEKQAAIAANKATEADRASASARQAAATKQAAVAVKQAAVAKQAVVVAARRAPIATASAPAMKQVAASPKQAPVASQVANKVVPNSSGSSASSSAIIAYASNFLGIPYVWGGTSPSGFDCSGFTQYVFAHFGINLPRVSEDQQNVGTYESRANLQPGDLVFFGSPAHHVGIYVGNGDYINSPHTGANLCIAPLDYDFTYGRRVN